jgi:hypothetical protein
MGNTGEAKVCTYLRICSYVRYTYGFTDSSRIDRQASPFCDSSHPEKEKKAYIHTYIYVCIYLNRNFFVIAKASMPKALINALSTPSHACIEYLHIRPRYFLNLHTYTSTLHTYMYVINHFFVITKASMRELSSTH